MGRSDISCRVWYNTDMTLLELARGAEFFRGIPADGVESALERMNGVRKAFRRGETVVHAGFRADRLMVIATGRLFVYEQTSEDHPVLVRELGRGAVLGLWILHVPEITCWPGAVVAAEDTVLVSLDMERTRAFMSSGDPHVARLAQNASKILSRELFSTWRKLAVMDAPSIEARIRVYLLELDNESGGTGEVTVPFNRERMAEYFGVTRPALSRSLGKMRDQGLIDWRKNLFTLRFK